MNIIVILVICILPVLLFLDFTKPFREKYPDTFAYVLSLVGTFVGIVLGLYFTEIQENNADKQAAIKTLQTSYEELEWLITRSEKIVERMDTISNREREKFLSLETPPFFSETLRSPILVDMLQPVSFEQFHIIKENVQFDTKSMRSDIHSKDVQRLKLDKLDYKKQLLLANNIIKDEIKLLEGDMHIVDFDKVSKKRLKMLMETE